MAPTVDPLLAFWHVANFFAPALVCGFISAALAKLFWRRELAGARWWKLGAATAAVMAAVATIGLMVTGADGRVATYAAMIITGALALGWTGFRQRRRR